MTGRGDITPVFEVRSNEKEMRMPLYEHVFISRQDLSNAQAEGLIDYFGSVLTDNGGKVDHQEY